MQDQISTEQKIEDLHDAIAASNRHCNRLQREVQEMHLTLNELTEKIAAFNRYMERQEKYLSTTETQGTLY